MHYMADILGEPTPELVNPLAEAPTEESGVEADEHAYEQSPESKEHFLEDQHEDSPTTQVSVKPVVASSVAQAPIVVQQDAVTLEVEKILEEDLGKLYAGLPEAAKPLFKRKGEEIAQQIAAMVRNLKVEVSRVIRLIRDWLLTIPKVNRFFLEQEAKIKTDMLIEYVEAQKEERNKKT